MDLAQLDALVTQNARTALWLTRNDRLVPGRTTNPAFVYRTPETHFAEICAPALVHDRPLVFGTGPPSGLEAGLSALFTSLLGPNPAQAPVRLKLTRRRGYRLVPPEEPGAAGIEMLSPVAFRPLFAYGADVPAQIVEALAAVGPLAPGALAIVSLELMVFAPAGRQPLVDLMRLDYAQTAP